MSRGTNVSKFLLCIPMALAGLLLIPAASYAHTYRSDGPIQVLLHVDPEDSPRTNEQSTLNFFITDADNQFLGSKCVCSLKVALGNRVILNRQITFYDKDSNHEAIVPITFPSLGTYQISLSGKPDSGYSFHSFNLNYTQAVSLTGYTTTAGNQSALLVMIGLVIVGGVGVTFLLLRPKRR